MIYEALLVPSESPPTLREIKRALLTYDKVVLIDPSDRGLIPNESFMYAMYPMFPPGVLPVSDMGPIRPMGKTLAYDDKFERTLDACAPAKDLIEVRSTYAVQELKKTPPGVSSIKLGFVDTGGYPISIPHVFNMYRALATNQQLLSGALGQQEGIQQIVTELSLNPDLAVTDAWGDNQISEAPPPPAMQLPESVEPDLVKGLTHIARARLGAFIKYTGYCEKKALVPVFPAHVYGGIAGQITVATHDLLAKVDDPFWMKRNRVLDLAYAEYLQEDLLDDLSVDEVLKLRTSAWGNQGEAREQLLESIFAIANEIEDAEKFDAEAKKRIEEFYKRSADLITERKKLLFGIGASMGEGALLLAGSPTINATVNTLAQGILPAGSIWASLIIGGIWAVVKSQKYGPEWIQLRAREAAMKRGAGMGLHRFFSKITK